MGAARRYVPSHVMDDMPWGESVANPFMRLSVASGGPTVAAGSPDV